MKLPNWTATATIAHTAPALIADEKIRDVHDKAQVERIEQTARHLATTALEASFTMSKTRTSSNKARLWKVTVELIEEPTDAPADAPY